MFNHSDIANYIHQQQTAAQPKTKKKQKNQNKTKIKAKYDLCCNCFSTKFLS